ncbi:hypothetical protein C8R46DRAFT_587086 [Mycena filopes]|nr:hypothetical protein C8R46DRAFT_587086 [Mycena filopes]
MILLDNDADSKASAPLLGGASGSGDSPPAYAPRENEPLYRPVQGAGEPAGRRFLEALLVAFGVLFLLSALVGGVFSDGALRYYTYAIPHDINTEECVTEWSTEVENSSFPYAVSNTFTFPLPSKTLLLLSKGQLSSGHLKIKTSRHITNEVKVKVIYHYYTSTVRDSTRICIIRRNEGEAGVGIFTPTYLRPRSRLYAVSFDVQLTLPHSNSSQYINALSTNMDDFSHHVGGLEDVVFRDLSLTGSNGEISTQNITAETVILTTSHALIQSSLVTLDAKIHSSNGHIFGNYAVANSLDLRTSNGIIKVAAFVNASDAKITHSISMITSNGVLDARINLGPSNGRPAAFIVKTATTNSVLTTHIESAPLNSSLNVDVQTSNAEASLGLPLTYEGKLLASTSNGDTAVRRSGPSEPDPACEGVSTCKGRKRSFLANTIDNKWLFDGSVFWDEENVAHSEASVSTSNAPATLLL